MFPLELKLLAEYQQREATINHKFKKFLQVKKKVFSTEYVEGHKIMTINGKIYIPTCICKHILNWYHYNLCHPGVNSLQLTLSQTMYWPGMVADCVKYTCICDTCQRFKKQKVKYLKVPAMRSVIARFAGQIIS